MKIFIEKEPYKTYKRWMWRQGNRFLIWLFGINLYRDGKMEPVYRSIIHIWTSPGTLHIEVWKWILVLLERYPYIHLEKMDGITINDET